jgi:hypothetical protein
VKNKDEDKEGEYIQEHETCVLHLEYTVEAGNVFFRVRNVPFGKKWK